MEYWRVLDMSSLPSSTETKRQIQELWIKLLRIYFIGPDYYIGLDETSYSPGQKADLVVAKTIRWRGGMVAQHPCLVVQCEDAAQFPPGEPSTLWDARAAPVLDYVDTYTAEHVVVKLYSGVAAGTKVKFYVQAAGEEPLSKPFFVPAWAGKEQVPPGTASRVYDLTKDYREMHWLLKEISRCAREIW